MTVQGSDNSCSEESNMAYDKSWKRYKRKSTYLNWRKGEKKSTTHSCGVEEGKCKQKWLNIFQAKFLVGKQTY